MAHRVASRARSSGRDARSTRCTSRSRSTRRRSITGFAIGFAISVVTIVASSVRIARFNVIQAIRDIRAAAPGPSPAPMGAGSASSVPCSAWWRPWPGSRGPSRTSSWPARCSWPSGSRRCSRAGSRQRTVDDRGVRRRARLVDRAASCRCGALDVTIEIPLFLLQGLAMAAAAVILVTTHLGGIGARARARPAARSPPDSASPTRWRAGSAPR